MRKILRWLIIIFMLSLVLAGLAAAVAYLSREFIVDYLWFSALNYKEFFLRREFYDVGIFGAAGIVFFIIFFLNFWVASRFLGASIPEETDERPGFGKACRDMARLFQKGSMKVYFHVSWLLAIPLAWPLYKQTHTVLFYIFSFTGPKSGITDPAFGKDIHYYLFSLPMQQVIQSQLLWVLSCLFLALLLLYWIENRALALKKNQALPTSGKVHLALLFFFLVLIHAWGYNLDRYGLLYSTNHEPLFFGPGFMEMYYDQALIVALIVLFPLTALAIICFMFMRNGKFQKLGTYMAFITVIMLLTGLGAYEFKPFRDTLFDLWVEPNIDTREKPFISNSIRMTRQSYNLDRIKTKRFKPDQRKAPVMNPEIQRVLVNVPVWDREMLDDVFTELQKIHRWYAFPTVDVDRYTIGDTYQQVYLAARELNPEGLGNKKKEGWINRHLKYTHGYGAVMTPAIQTGEDPMIWYVKNFSMETNINLDFERPEVYYGMGEYDYAIAPNEVGEISGNRTDGKYEGSGGVPLSFLKELLFSMYFKNIQIILGKRDYLILRKTTLKRRILLHRNIIDRIKRITPFFVLDPDPYLVMTGKKFYWIQDAYTVSDMFPNAGRYDKKHNYIKNAVKIVVDAYNGTVDYYLADTNDPIIGIYQKIYPGLIKSPEDMPPDLKKHLRYPKMLFQAEMGNYAIYHQTDPIRFRSQVDRWQFARKVEKEIPAEEEKTEQIKELPHKPTDKEEDQKKNSEPKDKGKKKQSGDNEKEVKEPESKEPPKNKEEPAPQIKVDITKPVKKPKEPPVVEPYYITLNLLNPEKHEFLLLCPMARVITDDPETKDDLKETDNLSALAIVGCDGDNYGKINVLRFPEDKLIHGFTLIDRITRLDTFISEKLGLWNKEGSTVVRGNTLILPLDGFLLYVQPIYLTTKREPIPGLKRIVVSQGDVVGMDILVEEAYNKMLKKLTASQERQKAAAEKVGNLPVPADKEPLEDVTKPAPEPAEEPADAAAEPAPEAAEESAEAATEPAPEAAEESAEAATEPAPEAAEEPAEEAAEPAPEAAEESSEAAAEPAPEAEEEPAEEAAEPEPGASATQKNDS